MNIADVLKKHCSMPFDRLRLVQEFDALCVPAMQRGIVFIFAVWSGPAIIAFQRFTRVLSHIDTADLDLVVLDTDCLTPETGVALWGRNVGGGGETIWVRNGVVVGRALLCDANSEFEIARLTRSLIEGSPA